MATYVSVEARMDSYADQQEHFYQKALIANRGDHIKAHAVAVHQIEEFIRLDGWDPRDYWNWIDANLIYL